MKISNNFPVLKKVNALFLVLGKYFAIIYRLRNGEIVEKETITVDKPIYTDKEGRFESRGPRGRLQGSGSVYQQKDAYIQKDFLSALSKELKKINKPYDNIYLFAPEHVIKNVEAGLPKLITKKVSHKFIGNFTKKHPTELLKKVKNHKLP